MGAGPARRIVIEKTIGAENAPELRAISDAAKGAVLAAAGRFWKVAQFSTTYTQAIIEGRFPGFAAPALVHLPLVYAYSGDRAAN